jgi:hypothetical protein
MCLITKATHTSCLHTTLYTDRTAYHPNTYFRGDPFKCRKLKINEVRIEGVCGKCLEWGVATKGRDEAGEVEEEETSKDEGEDEKNIRT